MSKTKEKLEAIELRKQGISIHKIAKRLGVSSASVHGWTSEVQLTEDQKNILFTAKTGNWEQAGRANVRKGIEQRRSYQERGMEEADFGSWEHVAGCMLWWGEGNKSRNQVAVTNCDANLLRFFVQFLKKFYGVTDAQIRLSVQYHEDLDEADLTNYWLIALGIPEAKLNRCYKKPKRSASTKWPKGICRIRVYSTEIVNRLWGSVQKYMGFTDFGGLYYT